MQESNIRWTQLGELDHTACRRTHRRLQKRKGHSGLNLSTRRLATYPVKCEVSYNLYHICTKFIRLFFHAVLFDLKFILPLGLRFFNHVARMWSRLLREFKFDLPSVWVRKFISWWRVHKKDRKQIWCKP